MITEPTLRQNDGPTSADRRTTPRHDAVTLGPISARVIGGESVRLLDFSRRGVLIESTSRLVVGAKATLRIVTVDASVSVDGRVVRAKVVKSSVAGLVFHTALALDDDLSLLEAAVDHAGGPERASGAWSASASVSASLDGADETAADRIAADRIVEFLATVPHDLQELRRRAAVNNW